MYNGGDKLQLYHDNNFNILSQGIEDNKSEKIIAASTDFIKQEYENPTTYTIDKTKLEFVENIKWESYEHTENTFCKIKCESHEESEDVSPEDINYTTQVKDEPLEISNFQNQYDEELCDSKCITYDPDEPEENTCVKHDTTLYCHHCGHTYEDFCSECQMLSYLLDNCVKYDIENRLQKTVPKNILEIKQLSACLYGVFTLKRVPQNVIFGPYTALKTVQSTKGSSWKLKKGVLFEKENSKYKNWMRYVNYTIDYKKCNLYVFQNDGSLYFRSSKQIDIGEELLVSHGELTNMNSSTPKYYNPTEEVISNIYCCIPCCLGFKSEAYLKKHRLHCTYMPKSDICQFIQCAFCDIYLDEEYLEYHTSYGCEKYQRKSESSQVDKSFKCETCNAAFTHKNNLKRHMHKHTEEKCFICNECDYKTNRKEYLKYHIRNIHAPADAKKYKCEKCDYTTNRMRSVKTHMDSHAGVKAFKCNICYREFTEKGSLKRHLLVHTGQKPFSCDVCDYKCTQRGSLEKHKKTHTGERPYSCHLCDRRFLEKCKLQRHMVVHERKPYKCEICNYETYQKKDIKNHVKRCSLQ